MSYRKGNEELKFDVRMRQINLGKKLINDSDVKSFESTIVDSAENAESLSLDEGMITRVEPDQAPVEQQQQVNHGFGSVETNNNNTGFGGGFNF